MKTRTSESEFGKETVKVSHTEPTLKEYQARVSDEQLARMVTDGLNRHKFLKMIRDAGKDVGLLEEAEAKLEEGEEMDFAKVLGTKKGETGVKRALAAREIEGKILEGFVWEILNFLPQERGMVGKIRQGWAKWSQKAKFIKDFGLEGVTEVSTPEEVIVAFQARPNEENEWD